LARTASFQGSGAKAYALDIARILDALSRAGAEPGLEGLPDELKSFLRSISEQRIWPQLQPVINKLRAFQTALAEFLDQDFNKAQFVADLQEIIRLLAATATAPSNLRLQDYVSQVLEFQASPVVDLVKNTEVIVDEAGREHVPRLLHALGSLDLGLIQRITTFLAQTKGLLAEAEANVASEEHNRNQVDPASLIDDITDLLGRVAGAASMNVEAAQ